MTKATVKGGYPQFSIRIILSYYHTIILSYYHTIIYHTITLSYCHTTVLSYYHTVILSYHVMLARVTLYISPTKRLYTMYVIGAIFTTGSKLSYHIISYHIISYHIMSYHTISYHIISYHIISYHIISYHTPRTSDSVHLTHETTLRHMLGAEWLNYCIWRSRVAKIK